MSQKTAILEALQRGERLTPLIALQRFQTMTLSQRVTELRSEGHPILSRMVPNHEGGRKRVAEYYIDQSIPGLIGKIDEPNLGEYANVERSPCTPS